MQENPQLCVLKIHGNYKGIRTFSLRETQEFLIEDLMENFLLFQSINFPMKYSSLSQLELQWKFPCFFIQLFFQFYLYC